MSNFLTLREAFERAVKAKSDLSESPFLEQAHNFWQGGKLRPWGYPCFVWMEPGTVGGLGWPSFEFWRIRGARLEEIPAIQAKHLSFSFALGGCLTSSPEDVGDYIRAFVPNRQLEGHVSIWNDLVLNAAEIEKLFCLTQDAEQPDNPPNVEERRRRLRSGGAKPAFNWSAIEQEACRLMELNGDFSPDDDWRSQACLIRALQTFCQKKYGREPSESSLKQPGKVPQWVNNWRAEKAARKT
jgi:hypothetical protein